ncbi:MAG: hypothetical protein CV087_05660 [Candidatus Brocadia sp. WS118]|nr:MAG: hypothetical protein CV087_05660 [Candidatus Brocadia sp. WS118]
MGHTVASQRQIIDIVLSELHDFSHALRKDERMILEKLLNEPLKHVGAISNASSIDVWAVILLAILIEQEKYLSMLEKKVDRMGH